MSQKVSTAAAYIASGNAILCGLTANELAALIGAGLAVLTFVANIWFRYQHLKLAKAKVEREFSCKEEDEK